MAQRPSLASTAANPFHPSPRSNRSKPTDPPSACPRQFRCTQKFGMSGATRSRKAASFQLPTKSESSNSVQSTSFSFGLLGKHNLKVELTSRPCPPRHGRGQYEEPTNIPERHYDCSPLDRARDR